MLPRKSNRLFTHLISLHEPVKPLSVRLTPKFGFLIRPVVFGQRCRQCQIEELWVQEQPCPQYFMWLAAWVVALRPK